MLDLHDRMAVYDRLGTFSPYRQHDVGEVARRDVKRFSVEGYLPLCGAVA